MLPLLYRLFNVSSLLCAVSAFYAECLSRKIQFNAHIWTKSKFLGMSIGVHNIGQGTLDAPSYTPKYTFLNLTVINSCSCNNYVLVLI